MPDSTALQSIPESLTTGFHTVCKTFGKFPYLCSIKGLELP